MNLRRSLRRKGRVIRAGGAGTTLPDRELGRVIRVRKALW